jgi:hypothetical protein
MMENSLAEGGKSNWKVMEGQEIGTVASRVYSRLPASGLDLAYD